MRAASQANEQAGEEVRQRRRSSAAIRATGTRAAAMATSESREDPIQLTSTLLRSLKYEEGLAQQLDALAGEGQVEAVRALAHEARLAALSAAMRLEAAQREDRSAAPAPRSLRELLKPGNVFEGSIQIPVEGHDPTGFGRRVAYSLQVLRPFRDASGCERLLVRHAAHKDEQVCVLKLPEGNGLSLAYEDFETICVGCADLDGRRLLGTVEQLSYGDDGYRIQGQENVHTFELTLVDSPLVRLEGLAELNASLREIRTRYALLLGLYVLLKVFPRISVDLNPDPDLLATCDACQDLLHLLSEYNAILLFQSRQLGELEFATPEDKASHLSRLAEGGLSRQTALTCSYAMVQLSSVMLCQVLALVQMRRNTAGFQALKGMAGKLDMRIQVSYGTFDKTLRELEKRVSRQVLSSMIVDYASSDDVCCICLEGFCPVDRAEEGDSHMGEDSGAAATAEKEAAVIRTPCGHVFHFVCAKPWFHRHETCPHCRRPCVD